MTTFDELKKLGGTMKGRGGVARSIDAVRTVAEAAADEANLRTRKGDVSKLKLVRAAVRPSKTGKRLLAGAVKGVEAASTQRLPQVGIAAADSAPAIGECSICAEGFSDGLAHCEAHCHAITEGEGVGGFTWVCACGPADGFWPSRTHAAAGLAVHLMEVHRVRVF